MIIRKEVCYSWSGNRTIKQSLTFVSSDASSVADWAVIHSHEIIALCFVLFFTWKCTPGARTHFLLCHHTLMKQLLSATDGYLGLGNG